MQQEEEEYRRSNCSISWWIIHPLVNCCGNLVGAKKQKTTTYD